MSVKFTDMKKIKYFCISFTGKTGSNNILMLIYCLKGL